MFSFTYRFGYFWHTQVWSIRCMRITRYAVNSKKIRWSALHIRGHTKLSERNFLSAVLKNFQKKVDVGRTWKILWPLIWTGNNFGAQSEITIARQNSKCFMSKFNFKGYDTTKWKLKTERRTSTIFLKMYYSSTCIIEWQCDCGKSNKYIFSNKTCLIITWKLGEANQFVQG